MKKIFIGIVFILIATIAHASDPSEFFTEVNDFTGGVNTQHLAEKIQLNQVRDANNFRSDFNSGLYRRIGFSNETVGCSSFTAANGLWSFTDTSNNEWLVRLDSAGSVAGTNRQASSPCLTTAISTGPLSTAVPTDSDSGLGKLWLTNKVDGLASWDGSTFIFYPGAPKAARVAIYKNRVVLADVSNEQSSLRLSGELNGADWTNDSRFSTSPVSIRVGGVNDGLKVVDFYPSLGEGIIFKALSMYRLLGNDQRDFRVEQITPEIGTIYPNTIAQKGQTTLFLSNRGLDAYSPPYNFRVVGNSIQNLLDPLARLTSLSKSLIIDSAADWTTGISSPFAAISTYTIVGSIATNNHTFVDTTDSDFNAGTFSNISAGSITVANGNLIYTSSLSYIVPAYLNSSFESASICCSSSPIHWNLVSPALGSGPSKMTRRFGAGAGAAPYDGNFWISADFQSPITIDGVIGSFVLQDAAYNVLKHTEFNIAQATWTKFTMDVSTYVGVPNLRFAFWFNHWSGADVTQSTMTYDYLITVSSEISVYASSYTVGAENFMGIDSITGLIFSSEVVAAPEYYTSQIFDTRISSPAFDPIQFTITGGTVTFGVRTSTANNCCYGNDSLTSSNTVTQALRKRYVQYIASFTANSLSYSTTVITIASVTVGAYTTGYFRISAQDVGSDISSWGLFTAAQDLGGDGYILYELQSSATPNFTEANWIATSLNTIPTIPINRYVFARITFGTNASTATPFVDNIAFNWNIGAGNPVPVAASWREGYYLFYSTNIVNITRNDRVAVLNRNNVIDTFSGSTISAVTVFNNVLEMGDALPTGRIYAMDKSTRTDPAGPIKSSITLRRFDGNGNADAVKVWDYMYATISREDTSQSQIFSVSYAVDGSTTFYPASNIEISTGASIVSAKSDIPIDQIRQGKFLDIKISELTEGTLPYTLNRVRVYGNIKQVE